MTDQILVSRELLEQALTALLMGLEFRETGFGRPPEQYNPPAIDALRAALAQPSEDTRNLEVVGEVIACDDNGHPWKRISGFEWQLAELPVGTKVYAFIPSE